MKLSEWAKQVGISYRTAHRWFKAGTLPVESKQLPTGTILVTVEPQKTASVAIYARVSSSDQKEDLERQLGRLIAYASDNNLTITKSVAEIGSGLNGKRKKLLSLFNDNTVDAILVEHKDRLARFGVEYYEALLASSGRKLIVVNKEEINDDLVQDVIDLLTSMCARLYGRRSAKNRVKKAIKAIESVESNENQG